MNPNTVSITNTTLSIQRTYTDPATAHVGGAALRRRTCNRGEVRRACLRGWPGFLTVVARWSKPELRAHDTYHIVGDIRTRLITTELDRTQPNSFHERSPSLMTIGSTT